MVDRKIGEGDSIEERRSEKRRKHVPVLLREVLEVLEPRTGERIFDGTLGFAGHAEKILACIEPNGLLIGVDRDEEALGEARTRLEKISSRFFLFRGVFSQIRQALLEAGVDPDGGLDGILLDLGVSSYQLDNPARGFRFIGEGPLDMRMSQGEGESASDWLATAASEEIEMVLREFGEESAARRIARAIVRERQRSPILTTLQLARIVESVKPRAGKRIHPATKVFQAIRIKVNSELDNLKSFLGEVDRYLAPGGRLVVISYHSLEDRIVKKRN